MTDTYAVSHSLFPSVLSIFSTLEPLVTTIWINLLQLKLTRSKLVETPIM